MIGKAFLAGLVGLTLICAPKAIAQQVASTTATGSMPLLTLVPQSKPSSLQSAEYYTQLEVSASMPGLPQTTSDKKAFGKALLETLGLKKETRAIIVSLNVSADGLTYPEIPILAYRLDGSKNFQDVSIIQTKYLPLQRLPTGTGYAVTLRYRYTNQDKFDVNALTNPLTNLFGGSVATTLAKPFFTTLGSIASGTLTLAGSVDTNFQISDEMAPYAGRHNVLVANLSRPNGGALGTITLSLLATPLANRIAQRDLSKLSPNDFIKLPGESPSAFSSQVAGTRRYFVREAQGLPQFANLAKDKSDGTIASFCQSATQFLDNDLSLTPMERVLVIHQALLNASIPVTKPTWQACFNGDADRLWLRTALGSDPWPAIDEGAIIADGLPVSRELKYAFGCQITGQTGPDCAANAPNPRTRLIDALAEMVTIGVFELPNVLDAGQLVGDRKVSRLALVDGLSGKAAKFGCFPKGLLLLDANGTVAYKLSGTVNEGKIVAVSIQPVDVASFSTCN